MAQFDAAASMLGYLHQVRYGLWILLDREDAELQVESLDDLTLYEGDDPTELLQLKHHTKPASLTDASEELWKTVRIWSSRVRTGAIDTDVAVLSLVTTAVAPEKSAAHHLRSGKDRDVARARALLLATSGSSKNEQLKTSFAEFNSLNESQQLKLLSIMQVADSSPDIAEAGKLIAKRLAIAVRPEHRKALLERVEGWWFGRCVAQIRGDAEPIRGFEVYERVATIAEQLKPDALPIDFYDATPTEPHEEELKQRRFVHQLHALETNPRRVEKAVLDYYRAFEQRSRWAREDLLVGDEVISYERRLVDEWERFKIALEDDEDLSTALAPQLRQIGLKILTWMEQVADFRIRPNVTEPYVMRGSYHMLADRKPPQVWWHPQFLDMLQSIEEGEAQ